LESPVIDFGAILSLGFDELRELNRVEAFIRDFLSEEGLLLLPIKVVGEFWVESEHRASY